MPNYMLLIYGDPEKWANFSPEPADALFQEYVAYTQALTDAGVLLAGDPLTAVEEAKTVSIGGVVTDGPFAEVTEHLGGYYLIDVPSIDEACEWAAKIPGVERDLDRIQVRAIAEFSVDYQP